MSIFTHQFVRKLLHEKKCYYINSVWFFYIILNTVEKYIREDRNKFEWRSDCVINDDRRANAVTNDEKWSSKSVDEATAMATRYRAGTEKGSAVTPLISNISELSFLSLSLLFSPFRSPAAVNEGNQGWAKARTRVGGVSRACCVEQKLARRGVSPYAPVY